MRVGCRRLRAVLAAYRPVLDSELVEPVREELRWLGEVLGAARDSEVVRDRLRSEVAAQPPELVLGPVERRIVETFGTRYRQAHDRALEEMNGQRYFALLDALDRLVADPPPGPKASLPAGEVMRSRLRKTYARTALLVDDALAQQDRGGGRASTGSTRSASPRSGRGTPRRAPAPCSAYRRGTTARR